MNLAIKGHPTREEKVIALLEMLGGINIGNLHGNLPDAYYFINKHNYIDTDYVSACNDEQYLLYSLEEFEERFPYKVGDKVQRKGSTSWGSVFEVEKIRWEGDSVKCTLCLFGCNNYKRSTLPAEYLQPYKEEIMEEEGVYARNEINCYHQDFGDKVRIRLGGDYEIKVEGKLTYIIKKKQEYPKTYEECCKVLGYDDRETYSVCHTGADERLFESLYRLKVCRDAYWQIAGKQIGLGNPWEPDSKNKVYYIFYCVSNNTIKCSEGNLYSNAILSFPTAEIRDAFFENFKELIEIVKELL